MSAPPAGMTLLPMTEQDLDAICRIEGLCFAEPWSRRSLQEELTNYNARYIAAHMDGRVAGYAGMWLVLCEAHVTNVAVHPDYRGRGIGRALMLALMRAAHQERAATEMTLEVRPGNTAALALYRSMGFETFGRRKRYYPDGEDALILWCRDTRPNMDP